MTVPAARLVASLGRVGLRYRSGLLRMPASWLGLEREVAARLGVSYQDYRQWLLDHLAPGQRYLRFDWRQVISRDLDGMLLNVRPDGGCLLVSNVDLGVCALGAADRQELWAYLRESHRPHWGLLLTLPDKSQRVIDDVELGLCV